MAERAPQWFVVPAGSAKSACKSPNCRKPIYFVLNARTGRAHPVDCDVPGGVTPSAPVDPAQLDAFTVVTAPHDGRGVSHFDTCIDAERFR